MGLVCLGQFALVSGVARADTYSVTSASCTGPGSFTEAATAANTHPGADVITFSPGLKVDWSGCPFVDRRAGRNYAAVLTESVTIEGNGAVLDGQQYWLDASGQRTPLSSCPNLSNDGTLLLTAAPGLFEVGVNGADNSGISVVVNNLVFREASRVAKVRTGASLTLDHVAMNNITNVVDNCGSNAITTTGDAHLTLRDSDLVGFSSPGSIEPVSGVWLGAISGSGTLDVVRTRMAYNRTNGAILWNGKARIVSSQIIDSGGVSVSEGDSSFVNSIFYLSKSKAFPSDLVTVATRGRLAVEGSSLTSFIDGCASTCPFGLNSLMFHVVGGSLSFEGSAVGNTAERTETAPLFQTSSGGSVSADGLTWMQPTALQDAAALRTLTGQAGLLTAAPGLLENGNELIDTYPAPLSPLLGSVATPGVLIDAIPNAASTNELRDPISGLPLTVDVFGNPRVDGSGNRTIGAIQTLLAPHLQVVAAKMGTVSLSWTQPQDPPSGVITGYRIRHRPLGRPTWIESGLVDGATRLSGVVTGLTNGTLYEFEVTGVNGSGDGPASNVVSARPMGDISAPSVVATPVDGQMQLTWTAPTDWGGFTPSTEYFVNYFIAGQRLPLGQLSVDGTAAVVSGLANGTTYEFCVYARAVELDTGACSVVSALLPIPEPVTTTTTATDAATGDSSLPVTGSNLAGTLGVAVLLLLLGGGLLLGLRGREA
jgi:hypothetical protein